jgi:large subunit ribosomal protein L18
MHIKSDVVPTTLLGSSESAYLKERKLRKTCGIEEYCGVPPVVLRDKKMIKKFEANKARLRRHQRIRRHLIGTSARPRLNVFRSGHHIYAQIIDDTMGKTLVAASSLDESLRDFKPAEHKVSAPQAQVVETSALVAQLEEAVPAKGKKASKTATPSKTALPAAPKREKKTPQEALVAIANNHKVSLAREVGKLVAQRAKEKGVTQVVFDRGGYAYHGRVAALAEGAREIGLDF